MDNEKFNKLVKYKNMLVKSTTELYKNDLLNIKLILLTVINAMDIVETKLLELSSEGLYEITRKGKNIILTYTTEEKATRAMFKQQTKISKWLNKNFPKGVFE